jgi:hypothetical protein
VALAVASGMIADKVVYDRLCDEMTNGSDIPMFCICYLPDLESYIYQANK